MNTAETLYNDAQRLTGDQLMMLANRQATAHYDERVDGCVYHRYVFSDASGLVIGSNGYVGISVGENNEAI